jgi:GNAT superfamily N-acetyltransferase
VEKGKTYRIREAVESEREFIDWLNYDSFKVAFQLQEVISDDEAYKKYRKIEDEDPLDPFGVGHVVFIAENEKEKAGLIWLAKRAPFYVFTEPIVWIYNINVKEQHRGTGLSKILLETAEDWTTESGYNQIGLHVIEQNKIARNLYEHRGYEQISQHNSSCFYLKRL